MDDDISNEQNEPTNETETTPRKEKEPIKSSTPKKSEKKRCYTRLEFSLEQEEGLIEFVRANPALYNPKDLFYKNKNYRDRKWSEFGTTINKPG